MIGTTNVTAENLMPMSRPMRYVKLAYSSGNSSNGYAHLVQIEVYDTNGNNVAYGKKINNSLEATDGNLTHTGSSGFVNATSPNIFLLDLEEIYDITEIRIWHYWDDNRRYYYALTTSIDNINWNRCLVHDGGRTMISYQEVSAGHRFYFDREKLVPIMFSPREGDFEVFCDFPQYSTSTKVEMAFDDNPSSQSHSKQNPSYPISIGFINYAHKSKVKSFYLQAQANQPTRMPKRVDLEGSNDRTTWTVIQSFTTTASYPTKFFDVDDYPNYYQSYRLRYYNDWGGGYCNQSMIEFYGVYEGGYHYYDWNNKYY